MGATDRPGRTSTGKQIITIFLMAAILLFSAGCQETETASDLLTAQAAFDCDVNQGFFNPSASAVEAIKAAISSIELQIKSVEADIAARQRERDALTTSDKSDEMLRLENEIKILQERISVLQNELKNQQNELLVLQNAHKSAERTALENEIKGLRTQLAALQDTLGDLRRDLNDASYTGQQRVGYIDYLKIGVLDVDADLPVFDPITAGQRHVVGVLNQIAWNGGYAEPIQFTCQISESSQQQIAAMLDTGLSDTHVAFSFSVFDFDPEAKIYFKAFHTNGAALFGRIDRSGGAFAIALETNPSADVTHLASYTFSLGVLPESLSQDVHMAFSSTDRLVKKWGVKVQ